MAKTWRRNSRTSAFQKRNLNPVIKLKRVLVNQHAFFPHPYPLPDKYKLSPRDHKADEQSKRDSNSDRAPRVIVNELIGLSSRLLGFVHQRALELREGVATL